MPWGLCLVSCSELCAEEAGPGLGLWSLSWLPACVEINLSSLHSNGSVACRGFMEGNRVRADGQSGFPGISLQARGGRGSSVEAKCCCCPALPACVGVEMGHSSGFWAWDLLPKARSPREQACSPSSGHNSSVGPELALGAHQFNPLLVLLELLAQLC